MGKTFSESVYKLQTLIKVTAVSAVMLFVIEIKRNYTVSCPLSNIKGTTPLLYLPAQLDEPTYELPVEPK